MTLNLSAVPFGRRHLRHMIIERGGSLWLALAAEGAASLIPTAAREGGLFEISLLRDGKPLPYAYAADEAHVTLNADGISAAITIDADANALRFEMRGGATLRLDGKTAAGVSSLNKPGGTEVNAGGGKYFFVAGLGTISFDDTWVRGAFGSVTPVLDVAPDAEGNVTLAAYELPADTEPPALTSTFMECFERNKADFEKFAALLRDELSDDTKYKIWVNSKQLPNANWCVLADRLNSSEATAAQQAIASLAFKNSWEAIDALLAMPEASPPLHGYAAARLLSRIPVADRPGTPWLLGLAGELRSAVDWWEANRSYPYGYYYAYRFETGSDNPPRFRDNAFAPDEELARLIGLHSIITRVLIEPSISLEASVDGIDITKFARGELFAQILKEVG